MKKCKKEKPSNSTSFKNNFKRSLSSYLVYPILNSSLEPCRIFMR